MTKDILVKNVDIELLQEQYWALQELIEDKPNSELWGLVEMIGDMFPRLPWQEKNEA
jgi:hypothetical protein